MRIICFIIIPLTKGFHLKTVDIEFPFIPIPVSKSSFKVGINMLWLFANECSPSSTKISPKCYNRNN